MKNDTKNDEFSVNFTKISNLIIRDPKISPYAKAIYMLIRSYSPSFPSYTCIMNQTGIGSRSTINKALTVLEAMSLIRIIHSSKHKSNLYEFIPPKKMDLTSIQNELEPVQEVDTNKTNLIKPNNNNTGPPTVQTVEGLKREEFFSQAITSLGTGVGKRYKPQERPTIIIEAPEKDI